MRKLERSVKRHKNKWMTGMTSIALATMLAAGGPVAGVQQVYAAEQQTASENGEEKKKEVVVYLNSETGDDKKDGTTAENAVKSLKQAMKVAKKTGAAVIYVSETVKVDTSSEWIFKGFVLKRAKGFEGALVSIEKDAVLTVYGQVLQEKDVIIGENAKLIAEKEVPKEILEKLQKEAETSEEAKQEESKPEEPKQPEESEPEEPEQPEEPKPGEPKQPEDAKPQEPEQPEEPKPEEPKQPEDAKPEEPKQPEDAKPEAPEQPEEPKQPEDAKPEAPEQPEEPKPEEPEQPEEQEADKEQIPSDEQKNPSDETVQDVVTKEQQALKNQELAVQAAASITVAIDLAEAGDVYQLVDATKEFEALALEVQEIIPQEIKDELAAAQEAVRPVLLSCEGLTVTGEFLPWYVQFVAEIKEGVNPEEADVRTLLNSYDLELWNLMTDTEYEIPEGEKVTVTMKAPDMGLYNNIMIVHTLKDGSKEYITPVIEGEWLHFETSSFSPFDVAGNKVIVGVQFPQENSSSNKPGSLVSGNNTGNKPSSGTQSTTGSSSTNSTTTKSSTTKKNSATNKSSSSTRPGSVKTGDVTVILPYMLSAGAAAMGIWATGRKKNREEE